MDLDAMAIMLRDMKARTEAVCKSVLDLQAAVAALKNKSLEEKPKQVTLPPAAPIGQDVFTTVEAALHHEETVRTHKKREHKS